MSEAPAPRPAPEVMREWHLNYLDDLRESGTVNMYGSAVYLRQVYPDLTPDEARQIMFHWMDTFSTRHPREGG